MMALSEPAAQSTSSAAYLPRPTISLDPEALNLLLFAKERELRARALALIEEPLFKPDHDLTVRQHRDLTMARIRRIHQAGLLRDSVSEGSSRGSRRYDAVIEVLTHVDHSIETKLGVHCGLFGATIRSLGTKEQFSYWLPRIENFDDFGCFALTELGHGSNVRGIETQAVYHPASQQFLLNTPREAAQKYWIGGAADSATFAVVFAQLRIVNRDYGIHVFIVRLRTPDGQIAPGIQIADCGAKPGLNGVDNGRIWFSDTRVPRKDMLAELSQVAPDGTYTSSIPTPEGRFGAVLAALTGGRVGIAGNAVGTATLGLTIAIRYCLQRTAFAPRPGAPEVPLLFYTSVRRTLMVPLATALVYHMCSRDLQELWYPAIDSRVVSKNVHVLSAGFKALFTWFMSDALQAAREACGGQGYKNDNRIAPIRADRDVMLTFEGANAVMLQQISKALLADLRVAAKDRGRFASDGQLAHLNAAPRAVGSAARLEPAFFERAFWRAEHARVHDLGRRFAAATAARGGDAFAAWNDCLAVAEAAARAHMMRRIYAAHRAHVAKAAGAGEGVAETLELAGRLWAAKAVADGTDFLQFGCITRKESVVVGDAIDGLCERMCGVAPAVLDGFAFPEVLLAPIAGDYVGYNSRAKL